MNIVKQIITYLIWTVVALLLGIGYMWILLGENDESSTGLIQVIGNVLYKYALIYIGLRGGSVIALLFIFMDIFYLKKNLKNNIKSTIIRFLILLGIAIVVGTIHYVLEKVIDII